ncbi:MAG: NAD(P)H-hydrate dehydratase [Eubacterium sp.]
MHRIISGEDMKKVDQYTIQEVGIPSLVLMERAALSVAEVIKDNVNTDDRIVVVCGCGNNGADGMAIARILNLWGYDVIVNIVGSLENATSEFLTQKNINEKLDIENIKNVDYKKYDIIIDAVFGVGLSRNIGDRYKEIIENINSAHKKVFAVDIPSGIDANTGHIMGCSIKADYTVTFGCLKTGIVLYPGAEMSGKVIVSDIGFPSSAYEKSRISSNIFTYGNEDLCMIPMRPDYSNKGTFGKLLIVAGSKDMSGAAYMSAKAAFRTGVGIVKIFTVLENKDILARMLPEAIISVYDSDNPDINLFAEEVNWADSIVIGPGLGRPSGAELLVGTALMSGKKIVIDADALNIISDNEKLTNEYHDRCIITPHIGEMSRLTNMEISNIKNQIIKTAVDYSNKYGITCALKDARTVVTYGERIFINVTGNNGMATAGSGDVLSGIIGGMLAKGLSSFDAASLGVFVHGLSGDGAARRIGKNALMATDIIDEIAEII